MKNIGEGVPPMPQDFDDRTAWDAIHWRPSTKGSIIDIAVVEWQRANQERVMRAVARRIRQIVDEGLPECHENPST